MKTENGMIEILIQFLNEKIDLDSGICDNITGKATRDYAIGLNNLLTKYAKAIMDKINEEEKEKEDVTDDKYGQNFEDIANKYW